MLLAALTLQSFHRSIMTMEYQLHLPDYIAQCINKSRPELHCDGQCVLMKKIAEKEEKHASKNAVAYEYSALYVHNDRLALHIPQPTADTGRQHFTPYRADYRFNHHNAVFHPPMS